MLCQLYAMPADVLLVLFLVTLLGAARQLEVSALTTEGDSALR
jgi:hypothetical protein